MHKLKYDLETSGSFQVLFFLKCITTAGDYWEPLNVRF